MNDILESLKKKKENLIESRNKIQNAIILKIKQLENENQLLANINGRIIELTENITLMEKNEK